MIARSCTILNHICCKATPAFAIINKIKNKEAFNGRKNEVPVETPEELSAAARVLAKSIARWAGNENQMDTAIPGLVLHRWESPTEPTSYTLNASICLIAQGAKRVLLGEEDYVYDATRFLISSVDLPVVANIIEATREKPYLGLILELDLREISQLIVDSGLPLNRSRQVQKGMAVGTLSLPCSTLSSA